MKPTILKTTALLGAACILLAGPAQGADFFLRAGVTTKTMPDGRVVPMWGFALDSAFGANNGVIMVPGPTLVVPPGDPVLRIHLDNNLSVPISLIIHGQIASNGVPVRNPDGRVRSFVKETPPGNASEVIYTWPNVKPGTYLYQSGTHPQAQVPMGLYGAMKKDTNVMVAYPGVPYASDVTLLYSEIDPLLNDAVAADDFGAGKSITSAIDYEAKYFLINGQPFTNGTPPIPAGAPNTRLLLRFLNAGLETRVPVVNGYYVDEVAEDGNLHPFVKRQFALHLPPAKTLDALFTPATCDLVAVYDRRLGLVNHTNSPGGMLTYLSANGSPTLGCAAGAGQADVLYNSALVAGCGTPPYTNFSIISGALPDGLTLNPTTGTIIGVPTIAGTNNYVAKVTDSLGGSATNSCSIVIAPGCLIGKWRFDESSGTTAFDSSGLGNHGRLTNGPVFGPGRVGGSLTFDGTNDYVFVPDAEVLDFNARNFTVALWVKTTSTPAQMLVEKQGMNNLFHLALNRDNTVPGGFSVWTGNNWIDSNFRGVTNGQWHHLAVTFDGTSIRLYRDGIPDRTNNTSVSYVNTSQPLNFGRFLTQNIGWPFRGMLDEICKYNCALTASEIAALASGTPPPRTLTIASVNPNSGVSITLSPADINALSNGTTLFTRVYTNPAVVTVTAPATVGASTFVNWQRDGVNYSTSLTTNLTMDADHTMTAIYQAPPPAPPVANFTGTPTNGAAPLAVTFTDSSTGSITNRFWNFGNGTTTNTTATTVPRTYSAAGTNTVMLTVFGPGGTNFQTRTNYIVVTNGPPPPPPVASFTGAPTNGAAPLAVTFTDSSTGSITNRFWNFGNGTTTNTTATTVLRTYNAPGTNTVMLTVFGPGGTNLQTRTNYIVVTNAASGPGPIVKLPFNEGSGTTTTNVGSAGGVLTLTVPRPTWGITVPTNVGGASSMYMGVSSGSFGVESAAPITALQGLPRFTITGWINNRDIAQGSGGNRIVACQDNGGAGIDFAYKGDGSLTLGVNQFPTGAAVSSPAKITTDFNAGADNWRFFAVTYDSALQQVKYYFGSNASDAVLDVTRGYGNGAVGANIGRLCIGNLNTVTRGGDGTRIIRGVLDDVQIHGAVLSLADIVAVQRGTFAP